MIYRRTSFIFSLLLPFGDKVKNKLPNLTILLILLCVKWLLNNSLFRNQFAFIKTNVIANLGSLFFTLSLTYQLTAQDIQNYDATSNKGKVEWQWRIQVGDRPYDIPIKAEFTVKNQSNEPLIIKEVQTSCHCTVIEYPKEPIEKGMTATIVAIYDAKSEGPFFKIITVRTNFDPDHTVPLAVIGNVKSRNQ